MRTPEAPPCQDAVVLAAPETGTCTRRQGRWIVLATILGSSMAFVDGTVVNTALAALQRDFDATMGDLQWVVEAYAVTLAAGVLVGGALGDRFGRRRVFSVGVAAFGVASIACGVAPDVSTLIAARAFQGVAGALLIPGSLAILGASFSRAERGTAIGLWSSFSALSAGLGLILGGWLIDVSSWRAIFLINVPLAVVTLIVTRAVVPETRDEDPGGRVDVVGAVLAAVGLGAVTFAFIEASAVPVGDPRVWGFASLGVACLVAFAVVEARIPNPMLPLGLFRNRTFTGANTLTLLLYAGLSGVLFFFPLALIQAHGYSATAAGAASLPLIVTLAGLGRWAGSLVDRHGPRGPLLVGTATAGAGMALLALPGTGGSYWTTFFPAITVLGLGMSLSAAPISTTVMGAVETRHSGLASGVNNATSRVAAVLSIAALGPVAVAVFASSLGGRLDALAVEPSVRDGLLGRAHELGGLRLEAVHASLGPTVRAAFVDAFRVVVLACAGCAALACAACYALVDRPLPEAAE